MGKTIDDEHVFVDSLYCEKSLVAGSTSYVEPNLFMEPLGSSVFMPNIDKSEIELTTDSMIINDPVSFTDATTSVSQITGSIKAATSAAMSGLTMNGNLYATSLTANGEVPYKGTQIIHRLILENSATTYQYTPLWCGSSNNTNPATDPAVIFSGSTAKNHAQGLWYLFGTPVSMTIQMAYSRVGVSSAWETVYLQIWEETYNTNNALQFTLVETFTFTTSDYGTNTFTPTVGLYNSGGVYMFYLTGPTSGSTGGVYGRAQLEVVYY